MRTASDSVSTGGKQGYTLIKGSFSWGLLLGVLVQMAIPGGRSYKDPVQELCEADSCISGSSILFSIAD